MRGERGWKREDGARRREKTRESLARRGHRFSHRRVAFGAEHDRRSNRSVSSTRGSFLPRSRRRRRLSEYVQAVKEVVFEVLVEVVSVSFCLSSVMIKHFIPYKPTETTCGQQVYLVSALADLLMLARTLDLLADHLAQAFRLRHLGCQDEYISGEYPSFMRLHG